MVLNAYAVLLLLVNALRLPMALFVVVCGCATLQRSRGSLGPERRTALEDRSYLLMMLAMWLVLLNASSWPLFYALLQSYVPEWPDVMCIYGITRIGIGSLGPSRFLPGLIAAIQLLKPLLLFLCGSWLVVYWLNRLTVTSVLMRRVLAGVLFVGIASVADATLEASYVLTPKREDVPSVGCCTMISTPSPSATDATSGEQGDWLYAAYYGSNILMIAALFGQVAITRARPSRLWLGGAFAGMVLSTAVSYLFLTEIAAPRILHLPHHRCAYDLITAAPESIVGIALFVLASLSVGWAGVAEWFGRHEATRDTLPGMLRKILFMALFGYVCSLVLFSVELALNAA